MIVAVGDILGLRELGRSDPEELFEHLHNLSTRLSSAVSGQQRLRAGLFREQFVIAGERAEQVIEVLQHLRALPHLGGAVRARIGSSDEGWVLGTTTPREYDDADSVVFALEVSRGILGLGARLDDLKAAAVEVDSSLAGTLRERTFKNCYLPAADKPVYETFDDLRVEPQSDLSASFSAIHSSIKASSMTSRKVGRFFIPLLVNMLRSHNLDQETGPDIDAVLMKALPELADTPGVELLVLAMVDMVFAGGWLAFLETRDLSRLENLQGFLCRPWIRRMVQRSYVPTSVLSAKARRNYGKKVAGR